MKATWEAMNTYTIPTMAWGFKLNRGLLLGLLYSHPAVSISFNTDL